MRLGNAKNTFVLERKFCWLWSVDVLVVMPRLIIITLGNLAGGNLSRFIESFPGKYPGDSSAAMRHISWRTALLTPSAPMTMSPWYMLPSFVSTVAPVSDVVTLTTRLFKNDLFLFFSLL